MAKAHKYILKPRVGLFIWLSIFSIISIVVVVKLHSGIQFNSHMMALLPTASQNKVQKEANTRLLNNGDDQLLIVFDSPVGINFPEPTLKQWLEQGLSSKIVKTPDSLNDQSLKNNLNELKPWRYYLLTEDSRNRLKQNDEKIVDEAIARLYSPLAGSLAANLIEDPLQLFFSWQLETSPSTQFEKNGDWLIARKPTSNTRLLPLELTQSPYDANYQTEIADWLKQIEQQLPPEHQLYVSGLIQHITHGTTQAKREISTIGVGSILGILLILSAIFSRFKLVFIAFIPLLFGGLFAFAVSLLVFNEIHLITLVFGASLVGLSIDYSLHYLCALRESSLPEYTLHRLLPGLTLGLVSSVVAYLLQAASPFPGLRQMAVFSASGLIGAWLTVVLIFPALTSKTSATPSQIYLLIIGRLKTLNKYWPHVDNTKYRIGLLLLGTSALIISLQATFQDDIRQLHTSPEHLLLSEQKVAELTQQVNAGQFLIVEGSTPQAVLEREESLHTALNQLIEQAFITRFDAISQTLPSISRQREHQALYQSKVYTQEGLLDLFVTRSGLNTIQEQARNQFNEVLTKPLELNQRLKQVSAIKENILWLGLIDDQYYSVILFSGVNGKACLAALNALAADKQSVYFIDNIASTSEILHHYKYQILFWLCVAYLFVSILLAWRYGFQFWRIVAAPALASLVTIGLLTLLHMPITVFHSLALLLILGIGLDAGIFLTESGRNEHTWLAINLSVCTTVLSFGLLSLSQTPVLHYFGLTVLIGIFSVACLTPCFVAKPLQRNN